jgi:hypothetical protein
MNCLMKTSQRRVLTLVAAYIAVWQSSVLIRVLNHEHSGTWVQLLRDAGHNIFGIPLWAWLLGGIALAAIAILAAPELIAFLPEIGEVAAEGAGLEAGTMAEAVDAELAAAESRLQSLASKVNPFYDPEAGVGTKNCAWAAREVDQGLADMFAGRTPDPYVPDWYDPKFSPDGVIRGEFDGLSNDLSFQAEYGPAFERSSMQAIADQLQAAGNGAKGIVGVANGSTGHVFNAVNYGGEVFFLDGQTGAVWTSTDYMSGYAANSVVDFLPTAGF